MAPRVGVRLGWQGLHTAQGVFCVLSLLFLSALLPASPLPPSFTLLSCLTPSHPWPLPPSLPLSLPPCQFCACPPALPLCSDSIFSVCNISTRGQSPVDFQDLCWRVSKGVGVLSGGAEGGFYPGCLCPLPPSPRTP